MAQVEFQVAGADHYDRRSTGHWIVSHILRHWPFAIFTFVAYIVAWVVYSGAQVVIGNAVEEMISPGTHGPLLGIALSLFALLCADGFSMLFGSFAAERVATSFEADARHELYVSLLGKSKVFHDRQRAGDIMARATDDTKLLSDLVTPGLTLFYEAALGIITIVGFIMFINLQLALVPLIFVALFLVLAKRYIAVLSPVITEQREQFGRMNAGLEETIAGIEVVKASAREAFERSRFQREARLFRDLFVRQGQIEARYLPLLVYGFAMGGTFLHAMLLSRAGVIGVGEVVTTVGLMNILRFPTFISIFAFSTLQAGVAGAGRILTVINAETTLDANEQGHRASMRGEIRFSGVSFHYEGREGERSQAALDGITLSIPAGATLAIVGQTGSGKSALTRLVNRTYDATGGQVLIDGVDVREWSLEALRSQIAVIEQDIFLFSRSIRENIAFGRPEASMAEVEAAARAAQAHEFISAMPEGYETVVGERGVTLSGGQRQRVALARAFLSDPRILILDDSTSAIDSATEDQIQRALDAARHGRTTLMITHRLSQIRHADLILLLDHGRVVGLGSHADLLRDNPIYRRIFARVEPTRTPKTSGIAAN